MTGLLGMVFGVNYSFRSCDEKYAHSVLYNA
jgi:hypothetical protein